MREHGRNDGSLDGAQLRRSDRDEASSTGDSQDGLIFDVSEMGQMNVSDLALLLTASRMARAENVDVWMAGLPGRSWQVLHALGLGDEFKQFPDEDEDHSA